MSSTYSSGPLRSTVNRWFLPGPLSLPPPPAPHPPPRSEGIRVLHWPKKNIGITEVKLIRQISYLNTQLSPEGEVNSGGVSGREASRYLSSTVHRPCGG